MPPPPNQAPPTRSNSGTMEYQLIAVVMAKIQTVMATYNNKNNSNHQIDYVSIRLIYINFIKLYLIRLDLMTINNGQEQWDALE